MGEKDMRFKDENFVAKPKACILLFICLSAFIQMFIETDLTRGVTTKEPLRFARMMVAIIIGMFGSMVTYSFCWKYKQRKDWTRLETLLTHILTVIGLIGIGLGFLALVAGAMLLAG